MSKTILILSVAVALLLGLTAGYYVSSRDNQGVKFAPTGTSNTSAKIASKVMDLSSASGTSTSIYNGSGFDWGIESSFAVCNGVGTSKTAYTGAGLAALLMQAATTSTNAPAVVSNTNYASNQTVSTSTSISYNATSTEGVITGTSRIVKNGEYLTFFANATNTASCTVGAHYLNL